MSKRLRFLIVLVALVVAGVFLYPTVQWYFFVPEDDKELAQGSRVQVREYSQDQARSALSDLQELARASGDAPVPDEYRYLISEARQNYRLEDRPVPNEWTAQNLLAGFQNEREAFDAIEDYHRQRVQNLKDLKSRIITLGLDLSGGVSVILEADRESLSERLGEEPTDDQMDEAVDLALQILTNRIDQFGVTEPQIREMGQTRISVEIPGDNDRERINSFLRGKGSLNFHIVDGEATQQLIELQQNNPGWDLQIDGRPDFVPAGSRIVPFVSKDAYGVDEFVRYIVIKEDITEHGLDGQHITDAQFARDPVTNQPVVNFVLDREGADKFSKLTRDNVNSSLAIVMDGNVRAYATITEEIPTGNVRISGFDQTEAQDIATTLRTAALPVDLNIINQESVGASLGDQAIQAGLASNSPRLRPGDSLYARLLPRRRLNCGSDSDSELSIHCLDPLGVQLDAYADQYRRYHPDGWYGGRRQRHYFRAHSGRVSTGQEPSSGGPGGLPEGLLDDHGRQHYDLHCGNLSVAARHRSDSRLCGDPGGRHSLVHVHGALRVASHL